MEKATTIGVDLAKHVFQVHGACADGSVAFRKKVSRVKFLPFLSSQPKCVVAMEACAGPTLSRPGPRSSLDRACLREAVREAAKE